jgi:hypothetical protein
MSEIKKKYVANDAIADEKIKLDRGDWLRSTDGGAGTVNIIRVDSSNRIEMGFGYQTKWTKVDFSYTDFNSVSGLSYAVPIGDPEAGRSFVHAMFIKTTTAFAGDSATARVYCTSNSGTYEFLSSYSLDNAPSASNYLSTADGAFVESNTMEVEVTVGNDLTNLTDGAFSIWILWSIMPA